MPPYYNPIYLIGIVIGIAIGAVIIIKIRHKSIPKKSSYRDGSIPKSSIMEYEEQSKRLMDKTRKPINMKKFFKELDDEFR